MSVYSNDSNDLIDSFIWKKVKPTYSQAHQLFLTSEGACKDYVQNRWGHEVGPRGIKIRGRKLWEAIQDHLHPSNDVSIPNSLWKVYQYQYTDEDASALGVTSLQFANGAGNGYFTLGWVIADNEANAKIAAMIILGPRAHRDSVRFTRVGISTWDEAKSKNFDHAKSLQEAIKQAQNSIRIKTYQIDALMCQVSFLEIGATFESNVGN